MEVLINDTRWNTEASCKAQILMLNWYRRKGSMVMLEIREMRNVQRWNSKLNLDNMEMFNIETGQCWYLTAPVAFLQILNVAPHFVWDWLDYV